MVRTKKGSLYTGITNDLARRTQQHNGQAPGKGSKALYGQRPVTLVYFEAHNSRSSAAKRESVIKRYLTPAGKEALVRAFDYGLAIKELEQKHWCGSGCGGCGEDCSSDRCPIERERPPGERFSLTFL